MTLLPQAKLIVVGSLNVDHVSRVYNLPVPGETVAATDYQTCFGGKGANQAIAAVRQEVDVALIGSVGDDESGRKYLSYLNEQGIDTDGVIRAPAPTGAAFVTVDDDSGENHIVVAGGANDSLSRSDIGDQRGRIESGTALLVQFEVPCKTVLEAVNIASRAGIPTIINPSPMRVTYHWDANSVNYVVANETEAGELLDLGADASDKDCVFRALHERRIENLIVTRGSETTLVYSGDGQFFEVEPLPVLPIDTVGAGDAFAGCFAAHIAEGKSMEDAVRAANCAGALTTLGGGAQRPIPDRDKVEQHLEQIPKRRKMVR